MYSLLLIITQTFVGKLCTAIPAYCTNQRVLVAASVRIANILIPIFVTYKADPDGNSELT